jgi:signal transduction histidine kinase
MKLRDWFSPPRHILIIFLGVALVSSGALVYLVWLLLDQEKGMVVQRRQERLEQAADLTAAAMKRSMSDAIRRFYSEPETLAGNFVVIQVTGDVIVVKPEGALAYYPEPPVAVPPVAARLAEAERLAFAGAGEAGARVLLEALSRDSHKETRAAALNGLAQVHRKAGQFDAALENYDQLAGLTDVRVDGLPAGLLARVGRASVFSESGNLGSLHTEAAALQQDVVRARWRLVKSEFEFYSALAQNWVDPAALPHPLEAYNLPIAEAFASLWEEKPWKARDAYRLMSSRLMVSGGEPVFAMWMNTNSGLQIALTGEHVLAVLCRDSVPHADLQCTLTGTAGKALFGGVPESHQSSSLRTSANAGLPWGLQLSVAPGSSFFSQASPQRGLVLSLLAGLGLVWGGGAWFIIRAISRELRVARLQADFVAAVSHEFRSPLSAVGQVSEMLATDRFESDDLRRKSYLVLTRETQRLRDLVESLLDFGRLEAGQTPYHFEPIEVGDFLARLIADFQERCPSHTIAWNRPQGELSVRADREALSRAVTNLLDNAVKYSPDADKVWVDVERKEGRVEIAVGDRGLGIPAREQSEIFERFVRGSNAKARQIKGTGVGLAMVRHIMRAHGGEVRLASELGQGSRFTLELPEA